MKSGKAREIKEYEFLFYTKLHIATINNTLFFILLLLGFAFQVSIEKRIRFPNSLHVTSTQTNCNKQTLVAAKRWLL
jgi:hypothetical protein